jgi:hypothetical protein
MTRRSEKQKRQHNRNITEKPLSKRIIELNNEGINTPTYQKTLSKYCNKTKLMKIFGYLFSYIGILLTVVSSIYYFSPKLDINVVSLNRSSSPLPVAFIITNQSELPVSNISFTWVIRDMFTDSNIILHNVNINRPKTIKIEKLSPLERTSTVCAPNIEISGKTTHHDMEVVVSFSPFPYWFELKRIQRYTAIIDESGSYVWLPKSLSEN